MAPHRSQCLEIEVPIEVGFQEILCRVAFEFSPGYPASWDDPGCPATWDVWEARVLTPKPDGTWQDVGDAPLWIVNAILKDFDDGGPTWEAATDAYQHRHELDIGAREAADERSLRHD